MPQTFQFTADPEHQGIRLDKFLAAQFCSPLTLSSSNGLAEKMPEFSRAVLQKLIKNKKVFINSKPSKSSCKIRSGDIIKIEMEETKIEITPDKKIKFDIIHDEKDFAVISKPANLVVYPAAGHKEKTLVNGLLAKWPEIKNVRDPVEGGLLRPGIVHRLDKDTSGIMIIAKNNSAFQYFKELFKNRKVKKTYTALVHGILKPQEGIINFPIRRSETNPTKQKAITNNEKVTNARPAITRYKALKYFRDPSGNEYTLVQAMPETGRMHQIRVHFAALGHNIVGDKTYKYNKTNQPLPIKSHFLHAYSLKFLSPKSEALEFSSPLPKDLNDFIKNLTEIASGVD